MLYYNFVKRYVLFLEKGYPYLPRFPPGGGNLPCLHNFIFGRFTAITPCFYIKKQAIVAEKCCVFLPGTLPRQTVNIFVKMPKIVFNIKVRVGLVLRKHDIKFLKKCSGKI